MTDPGLPLADRAARPPVPEGPALLAGINRAGAAAAAALADRELRAWDGIDDERTRRAAARLRDRGVPVTLGDDGLELLDSAPPGEWIVKSPGLDSALPLIEAARERSVEMVDELELGWRVEPRPIVGVTGTNGKSTVAALTREVLGAAGIEAPICGNTHFGPPLSGARAEPGEALVCEVSSFQLEFCPAFVPEVGVLTNVTQDHVYRHGTWERYADLKRSMFARPGGDANVRAAALPADDPAGVRLAAELEGVSDVATFGRDPGARWRVLGCEWSVDRSTVRIGGPGGELALETRLPGPHNALNVAAALALAELCGIDTAAAAGAIGAFAGVPGRFQPVPGVEGFMAIVDYAHNTDGLEQTLTTARALIGSTGGRLIVVVSALPFYDRDLSRAMGATAGRLADEVIFTTDRFLPDGPLEPEPGLAEGATAGQARVREVADRSAAIAAAVEVARPGDLVMVLGRGALQHPLHEPSGAVVGATDAELVRAAL